MTALLIFDGVFLLRPELVKQWELRILVTTDFETTVKCAVIREEQAESAVDVERRWRERYLPSQQLYGATARPIEHADVVVQNDDPDQPAWQMRTA